MNIAGVEVPEYIVWDMRDKAACADHGAITERGPRTPADWLTLVEHEAQLQDALAPGSLTEDERTERLEYRDELRKLASELRASGVVQPDQQT